MLLGRATECRRIETLVARTAKGASGVLVLRGEPGIGKTALLEHAAAAAEPTTVLRVRGVESEVEVAFAGLHELLRPVLGELERLPAPQRAALEAALGLAPAAAAEGHLVGAATLGLMAALAEERPVLVLADDVQWLDRPSASALTFAARRCWPTRSWCSRPCGRASRRRSTARGSTSSSSRAWPRSRRGRCSRHTPHARWRPTRRAGCNLSPKTVEYHLRHVYLKLGVNSRAALATALRAGEAGPEPSATAA